MLYYEIVSEKLQEAVTMNKKIIFRLTLGAFLLGTTAFGVTGTTSAAEATATPATATAATTATASPVTTATVAPTTPIEHKSMVLSMREVAGIFLAKYPNSAIHSISLEPENGKFAYKVSGYTVRNSYKISVDVITGKVSKEDVDGREKDIPSKIFNPLDVIDPYKAQAIAVAAAGEGSIAKGWELEAEKGTVEYSVTVYRNNTEKLEVTLNALDGTIIKTSKPEKLPLEEDD